LRGEAGGIGLHPHGGFLSTLHHHHADAGHLRQLLRHHGVDEIADARRRQ